MKNKIIFKIIFVILLFIGIVSFNYYIYMFIKSQSNTIPHSVEYTEQNILDISKNYVESFFSSLKEGKYEQAFKLLHESSKEKLFDSNLEKFENKMKEKYFNEEVGQKTYVISGSGNQNINKDNIFHAYYKVDVTSSNSALKNTSDFYKDKTIFVDVVKNNGEFKIVLNF